jgi:hypothetical protein
MGGSDVIIWTGWGTVVIGIGFLALMLGALVSNVLGLGRDAMPIVGFAFLVPAGVVTWYVGKRMNRNADRELVDPKTGQMVIVRNAHSLFFIRVEWWGPIMVVGGIVLAMLLAIRGPSAGA